MSDTTGFIERLRGVPGLLAPPERRAGAFRLRIEARHLADVIRVLLGEPDATLLLAAADDRPDAGEMHVHHLLALGRPWRIVHLETAVARHAARVPTLAALSFPASRFEREMRDLFGIVPDGHPDPRPLVRHGFWPETFHPLRAGATVPAFADDGRPFPFTAVQGEGVYEIPVGPVHAGVIEPGHFRFNVLGETILKMRARLYFTHKGTEKLFEGRLPDDGVALAERVSGDTSVGHALAYCQAVEALAGIEAPPRARVLRTVLLELERLYNHVNDVGAIIADTGFAVGQSHCLRLRETLLRLNKQVCGHRLLRGAVVPGGVADGVRPDPGLPAALERVRADFDEVVEIALQNTLVQDRLEATGRLSADVARDFGVVGYVARACGLAFDVRADAPFAAYATLGVTPVVEDSGDVKARLMVRVREARQSVDLIGRALAASTPAATREPLGVLVPWTPAFGLVEGWRGRIAHMVMTGADGRLRRVKIVDPSFFNWPALARALEDNIVPDFPLVNKSFNQSYSGNDL
jgi:Ni,Fe-hydrogenase III large subunit/Ni,Fe-hydrogenase III component G